jgi:hypothetical protein
MITGSSICCGDTQHPRVYDTRSEAHDVLHLEIETGEIQHTIVMGVMVGRPVLAPSEVLRVAPALLPGSRSWRCWPDERLRRCAVAETSFIETSHRTRVGGCHVR